jgi:hypothetical protein
MLSSNYWINRKGKRITTQNINKMLLKFIGHKLNPIDNLYASMRKVVLKYFKSNPNELKYFTDGNQPFNYNFEVEEQNGYVTRVDFQP